MPLETNINPYTFTQAANHVITHGLTAYGQSHTPNFICIFPATWPTTITCLFTYTWNSVVLSIVSPSSLPLTANIFVKKCHTIED